MHKRIVKILLLITSAVAMPAHGTELNDINALSWMSGSWVGSFHGRPMEAQYSSANGGVIVGYTKIYNGDQSEFFEFEKFQVVDGRIELSPSPFGHQGVPFAIQSISATKAVFENPQHDFPNRIIYELKPNGEMFARIEGQKNGQFVFENFNFQRVK